MKAAWAILVGFTIIGSSYARNEPARFTGGEDALGTPGYLATIFGYLSLLGNEYSYCQGAIINASMILTTASCANNILYGVVVAGFPTADPEYFGFIKQLNAQVTYVQQLFINPLWEKNTDLNDIAIIRVYPPFNLSTGDTDPNKVTTIKIGNSKLVGQDALSKSTDLTWVSLGTNGTISFGGNEFPNYPLAVQFASVKYMPKKACQNYMKAAPFYYSVPSTVMCMNTSSTVGMCRGDEGSLLVASDRATGEPYLAGLAMKDRDQLCPLNDTAVNLHTPDLFLRFTADMYKWIALLGGPSVK